MNSGQIAMHYELERPMGINTRFLRPLQFLFTDLIAISLLYNGNMKTPKHYSGVVWASWWLSSSVTQLYNQKLAQTNQKYIYMMTSSNGYIFRFTGPFYGEYSDHRWSPLTKANDVELWCFLRSVPSINGWVNNSEAGDLRRHRAHYDVIVMMCCINVSLLV